MEHDYHELIHANPEHGEIVYINWCLGNTCNFSCTYCPTNLHDGSAPWFEYETVLAFIDKMVEHYVDRMGKRLHVEFTGGEVTLFKDFIRMVEALKDRGQEVSIISNGSRTIRFWEKARDLIDHICFSFHAEQADPDHFIEVIKTATSHTSVHVNVMVKPEEEYFEKTIKIAERIVEETDNITFDLQTLLINLGSTPYDYTDEQMAIVNETSKRLKKLANDKRDHDKHVAFRGQMTMVSDEGNKNQSAGAFVSNQTNSWTDWWCSAGLEQIVIDPYGNIYRGWCMQDGVIANVADDDIQLPTKGVVCQKKSCHCNLDIMCTKRWHQ